MRRSDHSPSIVPPGNAQDVYLVLDDFGGRIEQAWRETAVVSTRLEAVIADLLDGQYSNPVRVIPARSRKSTSGRRIWAGVASSTLVLSAMSA